MNTSNLYALFLSIALLASCQNEVKEIAIAANSMQKTLTSVNDKIQVLNFGVFHMGYTNDAKSTEFDEFNSENQKRAHEIAEKIAAFKPTIIIVEKLPKYNEVLQAEYEAYVKKSKYVFRKSIRITLTCV